MSWVPTPEACQFLGISRRTLQRKAKEGKIPFRRPLGPSRSRLYWLEDEEPHAPSQDKPRSVLGLWDVHVPDHDEQAVNAVIQFIRDYQPDEVLLGGDFLELESASQHGGNANPSNLLDEINTGKRLIKRLRAAAKDSKFVYLQGNHEKRLSNVIIDAIPTFDGALTIPSLLDFDGFGIEWVSYGELYHPRHPSGVLSKLGYTHGYLATKYHASRYADIYGCCVRTGHAHTSQSYLRGRGDGGVYGAWSTPCLRTLKVPWTKGPSSWVHGFSFDEIMSDGTFTANTIVMANRKFSWCGKVYG